MLVVSLSLFQSSQFNVFLLPLILVTAWDKSVRGAIFDLHCRHSRMTTKLLKCNFLSSSFLLTTGHYVFKHAFSLVFALFFSFCLFPGRWRNGINSGLSRSINDSLEKYTIIMATVHFGNFLPFLF